jgi:type I restriction enzyme S subunit
MEWVNLTDICRPKQWSTVAMKDLKKKGYPVYGANGIIGFYDKYTHEEPTVMITCRGATCGTINRSLGKAYINGNAMALDHLKHEIVDMNYLYYYLSSYNFKKVISGSAQPQITRTNLKKIKIPVPSIEIQKKIVEVLNKAQALIDKRKKQIEALDQLIESIFYAMFGDPVKNQKGWEVKEIKMLGEVGSSRRVYFSECVEKGIPFYRGQEISRLSYGKEPHPELFINLEHYELLKKNRGVPKKGDLLLPSICPDGDIWMVDTDEPFYFKDGRVLWIELKMEDINNFFVKSALGYVLKINFKKISSGSTFSELKIFLLENITIPIPPLSLQNDFADMVEAIERQKELLTQSLELMEEKYKSIMDKAFKGQLFN